MPEEKGNLKKPLGKVDAKRNITSPNPVSKDVVAPKRGTSDNVSGQTVGIYKVIESVDEGVRTQTSDTNQTNVAKSGVSNVVPFKIMSPGKWERIYRSNIRKARLDTGGGPSVTPYRVVETSEYSSSEHKPDSQHSAAVSGKDTLNLDSKDDKNQKTEARKRFSLSSIIGGIIGGVVAPFAVPLIRANVALQGRTLKAFREYAKKIGLPEAAVAEYEGRLAEHTVGGMAALEHYVDSISGKKKKSIVSDVAGKDAHGGAVSERAKKLTDALRDRLPTSKSRSISRSLANGIDDRFYKLASNIGDSALDKERVSGAALKSLGDDIESSGKPSMLSRLLSGVAGVVVGPIASLSARVAARGIQLNNAIQIGAMQVFSAIADKIGLPDFIKRAYLDRLASHVVGGWAAVPDKVLKKVLSEDEYREMKASFGRDDDSNDVYDVAREDSNSQVKRLKKGDVRREILKDILPHKVYKETFESGWKAFLGRMLKPMLPSKLHKMIFAPKFDGDEDEGVQITKDSGRQGEGLGNVPNVFDSAFDSSSANKPSRKAVTKSRRARDGGIRKQVEAPSRLPESVSDVDDGEQGNEQGTVSVSEQFVRSDGGSASTSIAAPVSGGVSLRDILMRASAPKEGKATEEDDADKVVEFTPPVPLVDAGVNPVSQGIKSSGVQHADFSESIPLALGKMYVGIGADRLVTAPMVPLHIGESSMPYGGGFNKIYVSEPYRGERSNNSEIKTNNKLGPQGQQVT